MMVPNTGTLMLSLECRILNGSIYIYLQCRIAPAVVEWVNEFFYENRLVNNDSVRVDNEDRRINIS